MNDVLIVKACDCAYRFVLVSTCPKIPILTKCSKQQNRVSVAHTIDSR